MKLNKRQYKQSTWKKKRQYHGIKKQVSEISKQIHDDKKKMEPSKKPNKKT